MNNGHTYLTALALITIGLLSSPSQATLVRGQILGVISDIAVTSGDGANVFGLDGGALSGQAFTIDYSYNIALAPVVRSITGASQSHTTYQSNSQAIDWLDISITVNNITHQIDGDYQYADIQDSYDNISGNPDDVFRLEIENNQGFVGNMFRREGLIILLLMPNNTLTSSTLPGTYSWNQFTNIPYSSGFFINDFEHDQSNQITYERYVNFFIDIHQVQATIVPLPASFILFSSSLFGLFLAARRKHAS